MGLVPCGWHARCRVGVSHWIRRCGMEVRFPADRAPEAFDASEFELVDLCLVSFGNLFLYECIFLADLFSGCSQSASRRAVECGTIASSFAPSDRNGRVCWACCSKVLRLWTWRLTLRSGHWNPVLWTGYGIYVVAAGVQTTFERNTSNAYIVGILFVEGFGIGWTMQTALVAAQAIAPPEDRAVVTGIRNFFRFVGGSFGLAIASAIVNNIIHYEMNKAGLPESVMSHITGVQFKVPDGLTGDQVKVLLDAEMEGVRGVFWFLFGVSVLTFLLSLGVEDRGLPVDPKTKGGDVEQPAIVEKIKAGNDKTEENENNATAGEIRETRDIEER